MKAEVTSTPTSIVFLVGALLNTVYSIALALLTEKVTNNLDNVNFLYVGLFILVLVLAVINVGITHYLIQSYGFKVAGKLHLYLYNRLLTKKVDFFSNYDGGKLLNLLSGVSFSIANCLSTNRIILFQAIVTISVTFGFLFYYNYLLAIIILVLIVVVILLSQNVAIKYGDSAANKDGLKGKVDGEFLSFVDNYVVIKNLSKENYFNSKYIDLYKNLQIKPALKTAFYESVYLLIEYFLTYILPFVSILLGILLKNISLLNAGVLFAVYQIAGLLQEPTRNIFGCIGEFKRAKSAIKKLDIFFDETYEDRREKISLNQVQNISFKSLGYEVSKDNVILNDVDFNIVKNDFVSIKGDSGRGKSTIFKFLTGSISNDNVEVDINGYNPALVNLNENIMVVTQTNYLLNDTIINNIVLNDQYDKEEIDKVIDIACLNEFIKKYGQDKTIDVTATNISGGEKARICLARILIRKPKVLLLDEICSSLDKKTSDKVAKNIFDYAKENDITVISISHKDEFEKYSNKIINI